MSWSTTPADERNAYNRAHYKVVRLWGKANKYLCIRCGLVAQDWAYDGTDPSERGVIRRHSVWPEFYMPMCHGCHLQLDFSRPRPAALPQCRHPEGCPLPAHAAGWCRRHYARLRRYGIPGPVGMIGRRAPLEERFANNIQPGVPPTYAPHLGACHIWCGYVHPSSGFGAIWRSHSLLYAHRLSWEFAYGPPPVGARVIQMCGVRLCVRPDHLELA